MPVVSAAPVDRRRATLGGLLLWVGTVSISASTVVVLAVLSRHVHHQAFAEVTTLFGVFFVASLIPSGIPFRAAALVVDGAPAMHVSPLQYAGMAVVGGLASPALAFGLRLPVVAVSLVAAQVVIAIPLAICWGSLIAAQRFDAMGANLLLEAGSRVVLGALGGVLWGMNGLALGLACATIVALIAVPRSPSEAIHTQRQITSLTNTWLTVVLLGVFIQVDILVAPSGLGHADATQYDLAGLPSKGVYLVLAAISTLIFRYVRVHAGRRVIVYAATATLILGMAVAAVLVLLRGTVAVVLGQHQAQLTLLVLLCTAMAIGGATGVIVNGGIALGVKRPWPPLLIGVVGVVVCGTLHPGIWTFALVFLVLQAATLTTTAFLCIGPQVTSRTRVASPEGFECSHVGWANRPNLGPRPS